MSMIRRKGTDCCCNDWKNKLNELWERYQNTIRRIKANGTVIYPDGDGVADITELIEPITVDDALDTESTNPVENRIITDTINGIETDLDALEASVDGLSEVARTGDYDDLMNKPTIPAAQVNSDWNADSGVAQILNKPMLADVAISGSYNDLSDKPTIPAAQVNADWNATSGPAEILNKPNIPSGVTLYSSTGQNTDGAMTQKAVTDELALKQDTLTFDTTPIANSNNPVTSGGIKNALDDKQDSLTFDTTPVANSNNPVTSGGIYDAIQGIPGVKVIMYNPATDARAIFDKLIELTDENPTRILKMYLSVKSSTYVNNGCFDINKVTRTDATNITFACGYYNFSSGAISMQRVYVSGEPTGTTASIGATAASSSILEIGIVYI